MAALRLLAVAAASGRVGSVFLIGDILMDWRMSNKAAESSVEAAAFAQTLINEFTPDLVSRQASELVEFVRVSSSKEDCIAGLEVELLLNRSGTSNFPSHSIANHQNRILSHDSFKSETIILTASYCYGICLRLS